MKLISAIPTALLLAIAAMAPTGASAAESSVPIGTYDANGNGLSVTVDVGGSSARLAYSMKSSCGRAKGSLPLLGAPGGSLKGKRVSRSHRRSLKALIGSDHRGGLGGTIRYKGVKKSKNGSAKSCRASRSFTASYDDTIPLEQVKSDVGHYAGSGNEGGLPISFDVSYDSAHPDSLQITNLSFQTHAECWGDDDEDGTDDTIAARVGGLSGEIDSAGDFYIDETPDEDNEYEVEGTLRDGLAKMEVTVGGFWGADGSPVLGGPLECDSWGETYTASK